MTDAIGSVSVTVTPDARGFPEKLKADLARMLDDVTVKVKADTTEADAKLEETQAQADHLDGKDVNIKVKTDESSFSRASSLLDTLTGKVSGLGLAIGGLGPALVPLGAGAIGLGAALGGPLSAALGGGALFAAAASIQVKEVEKQMKAVAKAQAAVTAATPGPAKVAALKAYHDALSKLTPADKAFASAQSGLVSAFHNLTQQVNVLKPLTDGMKVLAEVLPSVAPLLQDVTNVFDGFVRSTGKFLESTQGKGLAAFFSREAVETLKTLGDIGGHVFLGLAEVFKGLSPTGNSLLKGLADATKPGSGLRGFIETAKNDIPPTLTLIGNLATTVGNALHGLADIGGPVLGGLDKLSGAAAKLPSSVAAPAAVGVASGIVAGPEVGLTAAAVIGLAEGFKKLYDNSRPLQSILHSIGDYFVKTWLPKIEDAAHSVMPALASAFHDFSDTLRNNKGFLKIIGDALVALTSAEVIAGIRQLAAGIRAFGKAFEYGVAGIHHFADGVLTLLRFTARGTALFAQDVLAAFGLIVDASANAFGWLPKIGGKVKAAQAAFHSFAADAVNSINGVGNKLQDLQNKIDAVGNSHPTFKVIAQTADAIHSLEALQAFRLQDKHLTVYERYQRQEQAVGPGGGQGRPRASGGFISGPGGPRDDKIPAWLSNGEFVVNAAATRQNRALLESLNARHFALGGPVTSGGLVAGNAPAATQAQRFAEALKVATDALNKETQQRQNLIQSMQQLAQAVAANFRSDLFAQGSPWSTGESPIGILHSDIANARAFDKALHTISRKGVTGNAFAAIAASGNLQAADALADDPRSELARYQRLYRIRQRETRGLGQYAANVVDGTKLDAIKLAVDRDREEVIKLRQELHHLREEEKRSHANTTHAIAGASGTAIRQRRHP